MNIQPGDRLYSNYGLGPEIATVQRIEDDLVHLVRGRQKTKSFYRWQLPLWFFGSPACGWEPEELDTRRKQ